jgi:hypothetical protein
VLRWHVSDAVVDRRVVSIRGRTSLIAEGNGWRLGETRLLDVRQKAALAAQLHALPVQEQVPEVRPPEGAERRHTASGRPPTWHEGLRRIDCATDAPDMADLKERR